MEIEEIEGLISEKQIEVLRVGGADMDGVFRGKRILSKHFLKSLRGEGLAQCDVIFGWDVQEEMIDGLEVGGADGGFADITMKPDLSTFRAVPWESGAATVVCDYATEGGDPLAVSPRQVLRRVIDRAAEAGYQAKMALELEMRLFREDQQSLRRKGYGDLEPLSPGDNCYSIHHASLDEDVLGAIRKAMVDYDVPIEGYNREHGEGMYEMNIQYADALTAADHAMLYKSGAKEVAAAAGIVLTFMAKYSDRVDGCSGHLHQSLWSLEGQNVFWDSEGPNHTSELMRSYTAGLLETMPELMLMYAPNVNSYKRLVPGSWAPTTATWGIDNRTAALRLLTSTENGCRIENRVPGADVNSYLGFSAALAGGLYGIARGLECPPAVKGDAYKATGAPGLPSTLAEAVSRFMESTVAREYFGDEFVDHYACMRSHEVERYNEAVTDWERRRYLEQV